MNAMFVDGTVIAFQSPLLPALSRRVHSHCRRLCKFVECKVAQDSEKPDTPAVSTSSQGTDLLSKWAQANGIRVSALALTSPPDSPRGVYTSTARKRSSTLMTVPSELAFQVNSFDSRLSPCPEFVSNETWKSLSWYVRLAVKLLLAKRAGEKGRVHEYIQELPKSFEHHPFHWSESELALLQSVRMTRAVHDLRQSYKAQYDSLIGGNSGGSWVRYEEFLWAVQCIRSRAFSGELEVTPFKERLRLISFVAVLAALTASFGAISGSAAVNGALTAIFSFAMYDVLTPRILGVVQGVRLKRYALVPGIDFMNHSSRVYGKAEVSYEYFRDNFAVACGEDYKAGDEVVISYGAQSNDAFLQFYGFVDTNNPADDYVFGEDLEKVMSVSKGTLRACRQNGFEKSVIEQVARRFNGNLHLARKALTDLCKAELSSFPTSLADDEISQGKSEREQIAIAYRVEKKRVLQEAITALEAAA